MKQNKTQFILNIFCCVLHFINFVIMTYIVVSSKNYVYLLPAALFLLCFVLYILNTVKSYKKVKAENAKKLGKEQSTNG